MFSWFLADIITITINPGSPKPLGQSSHRTKIQISETIISLLFGDTVLDHQKTKGWRWLGQFLISKLTS